MLAAFAIGMLGIYFGLKWTIGQYGWWTVLPWLALVFVAARHFDRWDHRDG